MPSSQLPLLQQFLLNTTMWPLPPYFYLPVFPHPYHLPNTIASVTEQPPSVPAPPPQKGVQKTPLDLEARLILTRQDLEQVARSNLRKEWSEDEDRLLLKCRDRDGMDWHEIAAKLPLRSHTMCYSRYKRLKFNTRMIWRRSDNELLENLVSQHGQDWQKISKQFKGSRNARQVKEHYDNHLRPGVDHGEWSIEEEMTLMELLNSHGKQWNKIIQRFPNRTIDQLKNRYFGRLKKMNAKKYAKMASSASKDSQSS